MKIHKEILVLFIADLIAINAAWFMLFWIRYHSAIFAVRPHYVPPGTMDLVVSSLFIYVFWLVMFFIFGLYRQWYTRPIFDELVTILKTLFIGTLFLLLFIFWDTMTSESSSTSLNDSRVIGLFYFVLLSVSVISLRLIVRFTQRRLLESGIGRRISIIIGNYNNALALGEKISHYPRLGYNVIGYISPSNDSQTDSEKLPYKGTINDLEHIIEQFHIKEIIITLDTGEHSTLLDVIGRTAGSNVGLKIVPDLYDIVSGQARVREIYGFPLMDINPELQRPWEETAKRALDIVVSFCVLLFGAPVWLLIALLVKSTSKGNVIYSQERVGRNGVTFHIYKFRSMYSDAESGTPIWATKNDPRVTPLGKFLRKSHLDEVPQFWNVLKGDMSLVGPRPERPYFIEQLVADIPYYTRRLRVRPGITGLYQAMIDRYDQSIDDVKEKVRYDLMYIESMSFRLDIKILFRTILTMLRGRGHA